MDLVFLVFQTVELVQVSLRVLVFLVDLDTIFINQLVLLVLLDVFLVTSMVVYLVLILINYHMYRVLIRLSAPQIVCSLVKLVNTITLQFVQLATLGIL